MIRGLQTKTLTRLRDHLLDIGAPKSIAAPSPLALQHPLEGDEEAKAFFDAVAEAMYLMVASDGKIEESERHVLRGALRELTGGAMRSAGIDAMLERFDAALKSEGQDARLAAICKLLKGRTEAAEAAFVLSAAVAFADEEIADAENEILNTLADQLDISSERAEQLLDELEQDSEGA
jgi:tellurite resistance protein